VKRSYLKPGTKPMTRNGQSLKRSGFKPQSLEKVKAKQAAKRLKSVGVQSAVRKPRKPSQRNLPLEKWSKPALVKEADDWFSWAVRLRDSDRVGDEWIGTCITCSKTGVVAYLDESTAKKRPTGAIRFTVGWDLGHFVSRGNKVVRFNDENCNLQCSFRCNKMNSGEHTKYGLALKLKYGDKIPDELEKLAQTTTYYNFTKEELIGVIHDSREVVDFYLKSG
jgi:Bacteriophage Lambda NinG protein